MRIILVHKCCNLLNEMTRTMHNALIQPVPYTDFDLLNLTSQTLFIVFLGLLSDIGETYTPCFYGLCKYKYKYKYKHKDAKQVIFSMYNPCITLQRIVQMT